MLHFPGVPVSVQQSSSEGPVGTNFSFLQIFCQNMEHWCWWNPGSLWYLLGRRSTILCKKVHHKFHASFICWCSWPSWPSVVVCSDTSFTKISSPAGNCTTVHCLLTTNCTTVHCLLITNCTTVHCLLTTNCTTVHCLLTTYCTTVHCLLTTYFTQRIVNFCRVFAA